jgi:predicted metal-dependent phosphoesterase TrpH
MIDLHAHSNVSDGELTPAALVAEAVRIGVSVLALTDHDTLDGLDAATSAARAAGVAFVPGIEIGISWSGRGDVSGLGPGGEMHLLGLGLRAPSPAFVAAVAELARRREARNREILDRMCEIGIEAEWEDVVAMSGGHSIGRPHFAALLVRMKVVKDHEQAFARYLSPGKPLYAPKTGLDFDEAVALIRSSGGIPVLAHPMSLFVAWGRLPDLVRDLKDRGLAGLEAWHPVAKAKCCRRLAAMGAEMGLYVTEGSDFHGNAMPNRKLGHSGKGRAISESVLDGLPDLTVT